MNERDISANPIVLLDLDDTILDFKKAEYVAISETFSLIGIEPTDEVVSRYSEINQRHWEQMENGIITREQVLLGRFEKLFAEIGATASTDEAQRIYETELSKGHFFMPGAAAMIKALAGRYRLFICTNGTASIQKGRINSSGIGPFFEDIFISEELKENKPTKDFFEACFSRIPGFRRDRAVMIGDSLTSDIRGGVNAGIKTIWYNPKEKPLTGLNKPDYQVSSLEMIVPLLKEIFPG